MIVPQITIRTSEIRAIGDYLARLAGTVQSARLFAQLGEHAVFLIKERTASSRDYLGQSFAPYSPKWADYRAERGYQVSAPDLNMTGLLWASLTAQPLSDGAILGFGAMAPIAAGLTLGSPKNDLPARDFFNLGPDDVEALRQDILRAIDEAGT